MTATSYGWLVLAFPLAGMLIIGFGWRLLPSMLPGWIATSAIGKLLLERFLIAFEAASLLLLVAAVGAVVLAGRHQAGDPDAPQEPA